MAGERRGTVPGMSEQGLGYIPDPEDPRDLVYGLDREVGEEEPPDECTEMLDRKHYVSILRQGGSEACTGTSTAGAYRTWLSANGKPAHLPSSLWLWTLGRKAIGAERENTGTYLRAVFKGAFGVGFCPEEVWPSDNMARDFAKDPTDDPRTFRAAFDGRAFGYYRINGQHETRIRNIKRAIWRRCPVVYGTGVSRAWQGLGRHDAPVDPPSAAKVIGGHAMYWLAYTRDGVIGPNSYGTDFGNGGLWYASWEYASWLLTRDLWAISRARGLPL